MSRPARGKNKQDSGAPYGTGPNRSQTPVVFWSVLLGLWFVFLVWMAVWHTHPR